MHLFEVILFGALLLAAVASLSHGAPATASRNDQGDDGDDDDDSDNDSSISTKTLGGGEEGDDVGTVVKVAPRISRTDFSMICPFTNRNRIPHL